MSYQYYLVFQWIQVGLVVLFLHGLLLDRAGLEDLEFLCYPTVLEALMDLVIHLSQRNLCHRELLMDLVVLENRADLVDQDYLIDQVVLAHQALLFHLDFLGLHWGLADLLHQETLEDRLDLVGQDLLVVRTVHRFL